jgi:putative Mg2+ transporter-C (MgtC) family protein
MELYWDITNKLFLAALLGGIVGYERERRNQLAGFRTHIILCTGSALVMMLSLYIGKQYNTDPGRIAAQVVSGIGFLGAGAILRLGASVRGVTTATSLWTIAGIGLAVGTGFYYGAVLTTAIMFLTLSVLSKMEVRLLRSKTEKSLLLQALDTPGVIGKIEDALRPQGVFLNNIRINRDYAGKALEIIAIIQVPLGTDLTQIAGQLSSLSEISGIEIL